MADLGGAHSTAHSAVVRPLSRAAARPCARPGCPAPARATLGFRYHSREAWLSSLSEEPIPASYDLCGTHADKTRPPHGWDLVDDRPAEDEPTGRAEAPDDLGGEHTVAVLAAALRSVPHGPEPSPAPRRVSDVADDVPATEDEIDLREALAELQSAVADHEPPEPITLEPPLPRRQQLVFEPAPAEEARHDELRHDEPDLTPRPVPAAGSRDRSGRARDW